jgi:hypothetical protein
VAGIWERAEQMLSQAPELEAKENTSQRLAGARQALKGTPFLY